MAAKQFSHCLPMARLRGKDTRTGREQPCEWERGGTEKLLTSLLAQNEIDHTAAPDVLAP
jgi:hypothetical protein